MASLRGLVQAVAISRMTMWGYISTTHPLPPKNTKGDRGVAFSISSRGKLIKNYFCAKNALISSSSKMFCVWKT